MTDRYYAPDNNPLHLCPMLASALLCLVVGISDGDTMTARCGEPGQYEQVKVRLQGIDAPERKQPFWERARQALAELTFQKEAELRCTKTDRSKRQVCSVWVAPASAPTGPRTLDAGLAMITQGMAWWYRAYAREQSSAGNTSLLSKKLRRAKWVHGAIHSQSRHGVDTK